MVLGGSLPDTDTRSSHDANQLALQEARSWTLPRLRARMRLTTSVPCNLNRLTSFSPSLISNGPSPSSTLAMEVRSPTSVFESQTTDPICKSDICESPTAESAFKPDICESPTTDAMFKPDICESPTTEAMFKQNICESPTTDAIFKPDICESPTTDAIFTPDICESPTTDALFKPGICKSPKTDAIFKSDIFESPTKEAIFKPAMCRNTSAETIIKPDICHGLTTSVIATPETCLPAFCDTRAELKSKTCNYKRSQSDIVLKPVTSAQSTSSVSTLQLGISDTGRLLSPQPRPSSLHDGSPAGAPLKDLVSVFPKSPTTSTQEAKVVESPGDCKCHHDKLPLFTADARRVNDKLSLSVSANKRRVVLSTGRMTPTATFRISSRSGKKTRTLSGTECLWEPSYQVEGSSSDGGRSVLVSTLNPLDVSRTCPSQPGTGKLLPAHHYRRSNTWAAATPCLLSARPLSSLTNQLTRQSSSKSQSPANQISDRSDRELVDTRRLSVPAMCVSVQRMDLQRQNAEDTDPVRGQIVISLISRDRGGPAPAPSPASHNSTVGSPALPFDPDELPDG